MAFDGGGLSFRIFQYKGRMAASAIQRFADAVAPEISTLSTSPVEGWVSWRHLLDREITEGNCYFIPWLHLALMRAERKIPKPLLRAYCRIEEEAERKARNLEFLPRKVKAEIRGRVTDSLLPEMPPTLSGIATVVNLSSGVVYADAMKAAAAETLARRFKETTDRGLALVTPEVAALVRRQVNANDLSPASFTDDPSVVPPETCSLGLEFLTWLWFRWEVKSGSFQSPVGEACQYMLEGPVTFFHEGKGAHNVVLSHGLPLQSREAGAALLCGKKVSKVRFVLADSEKSWEASVDASFAIRALKLPKDRDAGRPGFQDRMGLVEKFVGVFLHLYDLFLADRVDARVWERTEREMRAWVRRRAEMADGDVSEHTAP